MFHDRRVMLGGSIPLVVGKTILRELFVQLAHEPVTRDFGDDRGGGDAADFSVAFDDTNRFDAKLFDSHAINQEKFRPHGQRIYGLLHGKTMRWRQTDFIDRIRILNANPPGNRLLNNGFIQPFARFFRNYFGIVESGQIHVFRQNNGTSHHRSRPSALARFVQTSNHPHTL